MDIKPVRKSIRQIRKFLKKAPSDPVPEIVHDLRTSSRRLEAAFQLFGLDGDSGAKRLLQDLRRIRKKAGKVRDMDVLTGHALSIEAKPDEQDCLVEVLEHLGMNREKHARKLQSAARKVRSRLRHELKRSWSELKPILEINGKAGRSARQSRAQALAKEAELTEALRVPQRLNRNNLHPYRLKVKELRYILQLEDRRKQRQFVEKLGEVKDSVGEWHDWEELISIAADVLNHGSRCKLMQAMKATSDAKYKRAMKITLDMRKTYVQPTAPKTRKPSVTPSVKHAALPAPVSVAV